MTAPMIPPAASAVAGISIGDNGMSRSSIAPRAYRSKRATTWGTCMVLPTVAVQPVSAITSGTRSSEWARTASAAFASNSARYCGLVRDQLANASLAARAASSDCCTDASGACPTRLPFAGLWIS